MATTLTRFRILGLHGRRNFDVSIEDNKLILVGENGTGKSTFATLVYYFLSRQWSRTRNFRFEAIQATLNGQDVIVTPEVIDLYFEHSEKLHVASRRFPPQVRNVLLAAIRDQNIEELLEDQWALAKTAEEIGLPVRAARDYIIRYWKEFGVESPELTKINDIIASSVAEQVLFLPTYRRIEQDLKAIFRGMESDIVKLRERLVAGRASSKFIELVEFGMEDVERTIDARMGEVKESVRTGLNNLTGTYLRDVIKGDYTNVNVENLQELNRQTLSSIFARIDEETLPRYYKQRLIEKVEQIGERHSVGADDAVIAHFLLKLFDFYKAQQDSERDVRDFVRVCNNYLTGKEIVYDNTNYRIFIKQTDREVAELPDQPDQLELKSLSSGEKQIVSLFSHIYVSGKKGFFIILDEPELSLSVTWQRRFLADILATGECNGLIAVTHSPFIWDNELEPYVHSLSEFASAANVLR